MLLDKPRFPIREICFYGWMPSAVKKAVYRLKGYRIGRDVHLGFGSTISGHDVAIGAGTRLGFFSSVRGRTIRLGAHVQIGATTMIDTPHVEIGDGTRINEQVFIGGLQFPDSKLVVGRNCQIMQMTFINPTRSITIGDDTGIGGHCLLFGHTSWLSRFEGYPVDFDSIHIGNSVSIAWRVFLLPGTRIGDGAVVGANSLVKGQIPERCLAVGFPARVVTPNLPSEVNDDEKRQLLQHIVTEMAGFFEGSGLACRRVDGMLEVVDSRKRIWWARSPRVWRLQVHDRLGEVESSESVQTRVHVFLSLRRIPADVRLNLDKRQVMWIDIETKERSDFGNDLGEEVALYLRRYGVRFFRTKSIPGSDRALPECAAL
jgi:acetyltransferase-like isoleucine patch superfamily enzyme